MKFSFWIDSTITLLKLALHQSCVAVFNYLFTIPMNNIVQCLHLFPFLLVSHFCDTFLWMYFLFLLLLTRFRDCLDCSKFCYFARDKHDYYDYTSNKYRFKRIKQAFIVIRTILSYIHTTYALSPESRYICYPAETSQLFLRDAHILPKWQPELDKYCRRDRW
jgi:hypothetical protein